MLFHRMLLGICFCLFSFSVPSSIFAAPAPSSEAARVIAVSPGAFVLRGDTRTPLQLKDPLFIEDKIVTDASGKLQILFTDDTTVAVAPDSQVNIADFSFTPAKASFALGVGRGLARVVTGKVVEQNREGFKVSTPHATAGIRGTILTADVRNPSQSKFILSQLGAGHTVSVTNSATGQRTEMPKAGLTAEVGAQGNNVRPATPAEMTTAQTVTRQTRQTTPVAAANTPSGTAAQSPAGTQSQAGASGSAGGTGTAGTAALADANTAAGSPAAMPTGSVEDPSGGHGVAGKAENVVNQVVATAPSNVIKDMVDSGFAPGGGSDTPGGLVPGDPDTPGGGPDTPGGTDNPGALSASYAGTLGGSDTGSGTFSFDANLGSGLLNNGKMDVTANSGYTYNGQNGLGQILGNEFGLGFTNITEKDSTGQQTGTGAGFINGDLSSDRNTVEVDRWGVTVGPSGVDGSSGSGSRQ